MGKSLIELIFSPFAFLFMYNLLKQVSNQTMNNKFEAPAVIQHRITKVNGQIGYKKYRRGKQLGIGAFAKCYECLNLDSQKSFAVKVIRKDQLDENYKREKVLSEINIHKTLHHQNIVKFDNAFEDSENIYIVAELCSNESLLDYTKKQGKITLKQTRRCLIQIINAVDYMHQNQIIHRDLKLANIFFDHNMQIKIGDFGEATKLEFADEKKVSVCGTLNYLAPEIVSGPFGHSYEVDFWAIGVISFALLFGKSPFHSKDENETLQRIKQCKFEFPSIAVPAEAKDFIRKILVCDPKQRMNLKQMLEHPFLLQSSFQSYNLLKSQNSFSQLSTEQTLGQNHKYSFYQKLKSKSNLLLKLDNLVNRDSFFKSSKTPRSRKDSFLKPEFDKVQKKEELNKKNQSVEVSFDNSKDVGFGYILNSQIYGVYFNDNTVISCDDMKKKIYFIKNPKIKQSRVEEYTVGNFPKDKDFSRKYSQLNRLIGLLRIQSLKKSETMTEFQGDNTFVYVKQWWKNSQATMFSLSNNKFQVSFVDGSQTLFDPEIKSIQIKSKEGITSFFDTIDDAFCSQDMQIKKKCMYTKEILASIENKKKRLNSNLTR